jgi:hypothetical protein
LRNPGESPHVYSVNFSLKALRAPEYYYDPMSSDDISTTPHNGADEKVEARKEIGAPSPWLLGYEFEDSLARSSHIYP